MVRRLGRRSSPDSTLDLEAPGSRFTMRPAFAIQVGHEWMDRSEQEAGVAGRALAAEFGERWTADDPDIGETRVLDGIQGRGAAAWIPVLEWLGLHAAGGVIALGASQALRESVRRISGKIKEARSSEHRVMVSRGLAALLAMEHVFKTTRETEVLQVEFAHEPSSLAGRPLTETSYTGIEPWIVSLVTGSRKTRYLAVVSPEGEIEACIATPVGALETTCSPVPPPD
jgi:hypothetical protein